jgi:hypothetical protein
MWKLIVLNSQDVVNLFSKQCSYAACHTIESIKSSIIK